MFCGPKILKDLHSPKDSVLVDLAIDTMVTAYSNTGIQLKSSWWISTQLGPPQVKLQTGLLAAAFPVNPSNATRPQT